MRATALLKNRLRELCDGSLGPKCVYAALKLLDQNSADRVIVGLDLIADRSLNRVDVGVDQFDRRAQAFLPVIDQFA